MKHYLGLESKSLGRCRWPLPPVLVTDSFGLGFGICGLTVRYEGHCRQRSHVNSCPSSGQCARTAPRFWKLGVYILRAKHAEMFLYPPLFGIWGI